jgi:hypothetical protein
MKQAPDPNVPLLRFISFLFIYGVLPDMRFKASEIIGEYP